MRQSNYTALNATGIMCITDAAFAQIKLVHDTSWQLCWSVEIVRGSSAPQQNSMLKEDNGLLSFYPGALFTEGDSITVYELLKV